MTEAIRTITRFHADTGLPVDDCINTLHWRIPSGDLTGSALEDALANLYARWETYLDDVDTQLSPILSGAFTIDVYDLEDTEPRVPIDTYTGTFTPNTSFLPAEVAICVSYSASVVSGQNARRRRGRMFLGPLSQDAMVQENGDARIASSRRTSILGSFITLGNATTEDDFNLVVYSRTNHEGGSSIVEATPLAATAYIDDAYDTQRRRGRTPVNRTTGTF